MAALTITAANVLASASATILVGTAGEAITRGQPIYADATASGTFKKAANTSATLAAAIGIALNDAAASQPLNYVAVDSDFAPGATTVAGEVYCVGASGQIVPVSDLVSTNLVTILGVGKTSNKMALNITATSVVKA